MGLRQAVTPAPAKGHMVDWSPVSSDTVALKSLKGSLGLQCFQKTLPSQVLMILSQISSHVVLSWPKQKLRAWKKPLTPPSKCLGEFHQFRKNDLYIRIVVLHWESGPPTLGIFKSPPPVNQIDVFVVYASYTSGWRFWGNSSFQILITTGISCRLNNSRIGISLLLSGFLPILKFEICTVPLRCLFYV